MKSNIDIRIENINYFSQEDIIRALKKKYKIDIHLEERPVDILVIREPGYHPDQENGLSKNAWNMPSVFDQIKSSADD